MWSLCYKSKRPASSHGKEGGTHHICTQTHICCGRPRPLLTHVDDGTHVELLDERLDVVLEWERADDDVFVQHRGEWLQTTCTSAQVYKCTSCAELAATAAAAAASSEGGGAEGGVEEAAAEEYKAETRARIGALPFAARLRPCLSSQLVSSVLPSLGVHFSIPLGNARRTRRQSEGHGQSDTVVIVHRNGQLS